MLMLLVSISGNVMAVWVFGGKKVYFRPVTSMGEVGAEQEVMPGEFPVVTERNLAQLTILTLGNLTPESYRSAVETIRPYLSNVTYVSLEAQAQKESRIMRAADLRIMTTDVQLVELKEMRHRGRPFHRFKFQAIRRLYAYAAPIEPHPVTIVVDVMPPRMGQGVAESTRITHIAWPPLKIQGGEIQDFEFSQKLVKEIKKSHRGVTR